jgi:hypothetical protein
MGMPNNRKSSTVLRFYGWVGLGIIALSEVLLFSRVWLVEIYFTPLVWSGYILFMDRVVYRIKGSSWIIDRPRDFILLLPLSVGFWLIFEFYNLYIQNWHYVGLPEDMLLRWIGYGWAFATIWPAILITTDALEGWSFLYRRRIRPIKVKKKYLYCSFGIGLFFLIFPFMVSPGFAKYLAAPVWLGFIFLLDPLNYLMGRKSLLRDLEKGNLRTLYSLLFSGMVCGALWEFWNYWAVAKWHYTVPILGHVKIFEMPVLGYLGFPPFAVECYVMYHFLLNLLTGKRNFD